MILPNAHRVSSQIDRGHDSAFSKLDAATRNKFEALDRLVAAEDALAAARLELATACIKVAAAEVAHSVAEKEVAHYGL